MQNVFEIATRVSTPLALAGLFGAVIFFAIRQILKINIFPSLTKQGSFDLIKFIVDRLFVLCLVAMVLGFAGYIVTSVLADQIKTPLSREPSNETSPPTQGPAEARLKSVTVRFTLAKGDNKDDNTRLAISISKGGRAIAKNDNFADGDEFNDPGNGGPYPLEIQSKVTKADFQGSTTTLNITPQGGAGHDTIIMNTIVEAMFSDGEVLTSQSGTRRTENAATTVFDN